MNNGSVQKRVLYRVAWMDRNCGVGLIFSRAYERKVALQLAERGLLVHENGVFTLNKDYKQND